MSIKQLKMQLKTLFQVEMYVFVISKVFNSQLMKRKYKQ